MPAATPLLSLFGHGARMLPAAYARAFDKSNNNDWRDAEGIAEVVQRPTMLFVAPKTTEQLNLQALHRVRERLVRNTTATVNEIRSFPLDRDIAVAWKSRDRVSGGATANLDEPSARRR
jgi:transposase